MKPHNCVLVLVAIAMLSGVTCHVAFAATSHDEPKKLPHVVRRNDGAIQRDTKNLPPVDVPGKAPPPNPGAWTSITSTLPGNSIAIGGGGGGSAHTSDNQQSTANQKHSKNPKSRCDGSDTAGAATGGDPIDYSTGSKTARSLSTTKMRRR